MNIRNQERDINIVDMFWALCSKWRVIIICGLIFALLLGGIGYYNNTKETDIETLQAELEEEDEIYIDMYLTYLDLYKTQKDYNNLSPLMQLTPNDFYVNVLTYYVDNYYVVEYPVITERDNIDALIQAYKTVLCTDQIARDIVETMGMEDEAVLYSSEMVDLKNVYGDVDVTEQETNIITVTIYGNTAEDCAKVSDIVKATIESSKEDMTKQFGKHDISIIEDMTKQASDIDLSTYQKRNIDNLNTYKLSLDSSEGNLSKAALSYVDIVKTDVENEENEKESPIEIKMIVLGFILGVFLVLFFAALGYISNKKLRYEDNYEKVYGIKLLGTITGRFKNKKRVFEFVDRWIEEKRHANIHKFTEDEEEDMVVSGIKLLAKKSGVKKVYLTGATVSQIPEDLVDTFAKRLGKDDIELILGKSIIYNAEALETASEVGNVVIIDKLGIVMYDEIYSMLDTCDVHKINVLGGILVR